MKKNYYLYAGLLMLMCMTTSCIHSANENVSTERSSASPTTPVLDSQNDYTPKTSEEPVNDKQEVSNE